MIAPGAHATTGLLDPALLARLSHLRLPVSHRITGALVGRHRSPSHGSSIEFAEHKEYAPGDEIRHLDWKAYAKLDRYYVKRFEDETNLSIYLLVDCSGSMAYGSTGDTKLRYAARLAAALGFVLLRQQDSVGLITFQDQVGQYVPPRARSSHLQDLVKVLDSLEPSGTTSIDAGLQHVIEHARHRSMVFVLSDFFDASPGFERLLGQLARRHEVALLHVLDPDELSFPFDDVTVFRSMEGASELLAEPKVIRSTYIREIEAFQDRLRRLCVKNGVDYQMAQSDEPVDECVLSYLASRRRSATERRHAI